MKKLRLYTNELGPDCKCQRHLCFEIIPQEDAFMCLHDISKKMHAISKTGMMLKYRRGKYDHKCCSISEEVTESVVSHICSLKGRQNHCSRKNSKRVYLPDMLNINRMYEMYKEKKLPPVSYEYYRNICNMIFNIAFGYPCSDTCTSCDKYQTDVTALQHTLSGPSLPDKEKNKI
ncbi:hypothetical protein PR048_015549 [Dryococelus australis]|uniref:Uncharacterized protein n=1 Tax=Dryococelus australis TaxID=614101 RepID=A0ABQ9HH87_9NEOP|nr:hypothetical protein PR048_015549 [Dryococelus australis]